MTLIRLLSIGWLGLAALTLPGTAQAQLARGPPCVDRTQLVEHLRTMFGEQAIGRGLADGGFVFELYAGQSGAWTVIATTPQGMSCYVASGEGWEPLPKPDVFAGR